MTAKQGSNVPLFTTLIQHQQRQSLQYFDKWYNADPEHVLAH